MKFLHLTVDFQFNVDSIEFDLFLYTCITDCVHRFGNQNRAGKLNFQQIHTLEIVKVIKIIFFSFSVNLLSEQCTVPKL